MIWHRDFGDGNSSFGKEACNLPIVAAGIPVMKNHQCPIRCSAFSQLRPNKVIFLDVGDDIRLEFEKLPILAELWFMTMWQSIKGWGCSSAICKVAKRFNGRNIHRTGKGAFCIKQKSCLYLVLFSASRPLFIPTVKPTIKHVICFLFGWPFVFRMPGLPAHIWQGIERCSKGSRSRKRHQ